MIPDTVLRPYQRRGREAIVSNPLKATALFFRMGFGKTLPTLCAIHDLMWDHLAIRKVLVVAPKRVAMIAWPQQIDEWFPNTRYLVVHSDKPRQIREDAELYLLSYSSLPWLYREVINNPAGLPKFDMVVFDESTYVKNHESTRWKLCHALFEQIPRKVILSGRPAPNGLLDFWAQIALLDGGQRLFRSYSAFRDCKFMAAGEGSFKRYVPLVGTKDWIAEQLADIAITITEDDTVHIPPLIINHVDIDLDAKTMKQYKIAEKQNLIDIPGALIDLDSIAKQLMKLRQFTQGFIYDNGSVVRVHREKLEALKDIVDNSEGENILCSIQFHEDVEMIRSVYPDVPCINSSTKDKDTQRYLESWNRGELPLLLVNPSSAAHGLNLQAGGSVIVTYSPTWNLDEDEQLIARLHRSGQTKPVVVHRLHVRGTIDDIIFEALSGKAKTQDDVLAKMIEYREQLKRGRHGDKPRNRSRVK